MRHQKMKVFINFGDIRCVVPVGDGSLSVKEVISLAIERYKKATSKVIYLFFLLLLIIILTSTIHQFNQILNADFLNNNNNNNHIKPLT